VLAPNKQLGTDSVDKKKNTGTRDTVQSRKQDHGDSTIILFKKITLSMKNSTPCSFH